MMATSTFMGASESRTARVDVKEDTISGQIENVPIQFTQRGDARLAYQDFPGPDPPILYIHGYGSSRKLVSDYVPAWLQSIRESFGGRRLVFYDRREYGDSTKLQTVTSLDEQVDDARAIASAAGLSQYVVFGLSLGGLIAPAYSASYPEGVLGVIIHGGYPVGRNVLDKENRDLGIALAPLNLLHRIGVDSPRAKRMVGTGIAASSYYLMRWYIKGQVRDATGWSDELLDPFLVGQWRTRQLVAHFVERDATRDWDVRPHFRTLECPVLVLHGTHDPIVPVDEWDDLEAYAPTAHLEIFENGSHSLDEAPERYRAIAQTFLDRVEAKQASNVP